MLMRRTTSRLVAKIISSTGFALVLPALLFVSAASPARAADLGKVTVSVASLLQEKHYSRHRLDDKMSKEILDQYLHDLDPDKLFFTQADVDGFRAKYETTLDDAILAGNIQPAENIFAVYKQRVIDRVASIKTLAAGKYDFTGKETVVLDRKNAPWPKDAADADDLWRKRIEYNLLQESLNDHAVKSPSEVVTRRANQILRDTTDMDEESVASTFLGSLSTVYDPHTSYMSASDLKDFKSEMKTSFEGVGLQLRVKDGVASIEAILPGGPADLDGHLKLNDRIVAVAQGTGEFEDVVDMRIDHVIKKIRGERGTMVRLQVIPASAGDSSKRTVVNLRRDEIQDKAQRASARIIDVPGAGGTSVRVGWIELPLFYEDLDHRGGADASSTTKDVALLLSRLEKEGIQGLVMDLRYDGGGSLAEAIHLTGLFIPKGPVVQVKDADGNVSVYENRNASALYNGPMVVVSNRLSASASEIFTAALQDYGRAVIVGDERSFGKGTVQQLTDLGGISFWGFGQESGLGAVKLTTEKFYRVSGGATQFNGVKSDIVLPSLSDDPAIGEGSLPHPLPYDEVAPLRIARSTSLDAIKGPLQALSRARVATEPEFKYISEDKALLQQRTGDHQVTINLQDLKADAAAAKLRLATRKKERESRGTPLDGAAFAVTLDNVNDPELHKATADQEKDSLSAQAGSDSEAGAALPDAVRNEALHISADLVNLSRNDKTALVHAAAPVL